MDSSPSRAPASQYLGIRVKASGRKHQRICEQRHHEFVPNGTTTTSCRLSELASQLSPDNSSHLPRLPRLIISASLLLYLFGGFIFPQSRVMVFIITSLLLAADFYYLKNIAGRRLVGLRWWNEVDLQTGDSQWVFESSEPGTRTVNATDSRFFWLALYSQPVLWVALSIAAFFNFRLIWLPLVAIALALTVTNTLAFSRCDKFSQASNIAGSALSSGNLAGSIASNMVGRLFTFGR